MVSGERRNDLALMRAGRGDWVAKIGAEGVQAIGIREPGIGIAIKVADGAARACIRRRSRCSTSWGCSTTRGARELAGWREPVVRNYRGIVTGTIRSLVVLDKPPAVAANQRTQAACSPGSA